MNRQKIKKITPFTPPTNVTKAIQELRSQSAKAWEKKGVRMALALFHDVVATVPAYRTFLKTHHINPKNIRTAHDLATIPPVSKENYLRTAPYLDLFPNRDIASAVTVSATSGSSGIPFYIPRGGAHDDLYQYQTEIFLKEQFDIDTKKTLVILGFGLGIWIGGMFTYRILERISNKGYAMTIVPAGTNKEQFMQGIKKFAPLYDQIILAGYPPFIKDVLDEGPQYGITWKNHEIKILTAAEGYSEKFREYLAKKSSIKNMFKDIINIYGTVELGTMAHETTLANLIRHLAVKNKKLSTSLFDEIGSAPTLCQYHPQIVHFDEILIDKKKELLGTGHCTQIPLVRYRFKDMGGVIPYDRMLKKIADAGIDLAREAKLANVALSKTHRLPFVYINARSDFSFSCYGIVLYPEYVRDATLHAKVKKLITGRFTIRIDLDAHYNQFIELNIEMRAGIKENSTIEKLITRATVDLFLKNSTEYNHLYHSSPTYRERLTPKIKFWAHHDPKYFSRAGKQAWLQK